MACLDVSWASVYDDERGCLSMKRLRDLLGSLKMAVPLLLAIAGVLAWGTIYETRFGTAAVQRVIYHSWWFQGLLGFLALNLAVAALERYPWKRKHIPFLLAHLGIILILLGGIIGGRFGIEGQLIIPEGQAERALELPTNVLVVHEPNPGAHHVFPTSFETTAWRHEPHTLFGVPFKDRVIQLVVDRYYPDAQVEEQVTDDGETENPAVHVVIHHGEQQESLWLLARDPERFGLRWGEAHLFFLEPQTEQELASLLGQPQNIAVDGKVTDGSAGPDSGSFSGVATVDMGDGTAPLPGVPFTVTVTGQGMGTLLLTVGDSGLPDATVAEGGVTIQ